MLKLMLFVLPIYVVISPCILNLRLLWSFFLYVSGLSFMFEKDTHVIEEV